MKSFSTLLVALLIGSTFSMTCSAVCAQEKQNPWWMQSKSSKEVIAQLKMAKENRSEMEKALLKAPAKHRRAMEFLVVNMPAKDLQTLKADFLLTNVQLAYDAFEKVPWKNQIPESIFFNDILPYANINETRDSWRADFMNRFSEVVKDCKTPSEAAQKLNEKVFGAVKVKYSTKRKKANQSPAESMEQGLASCTGLSIILVDACRSVGVPARVVGIPSWVNKRGNHTWVEIWDRDWHFTGAAEPNGKGLNHTWFQHDASLAKKESRMNAIYAASFQKTDLVFPMVWSREAERISAVNVTDRYTQNVKVEPAKQTRLLVRVWDQEKKNRIAADVKLVCLQCDDKSLLGKSRGESADTNDILAYEVFRDQRFRIEINFDGKKMEKTITTKDITEQTVDVVFKPATEK